MNLEKIVHFGSLARGLVLGTALLISPYATSSLVYSAEPAPASQESKEKDPMKSISSCLYDATQGALARIGIQGGYYKTKPKERLELKGIFVPYYYDRGKFLMPETKAIEKELSDYVDKNFLILLEKEGKVRFKPEGSKIKTTVKIKKGVVEIQYDISLLVSRDDKFETRFSMNTLAMPLKSKLYEMLEIARFITDSHKEDPDMISITDIVKMAKERNLRVQSMGFTDLPDCSFYRISWRKESEDYVQFGPMSVKTIKDEKENEKNAKSKEKGYVGPLYFQFLNRYNKKENKAPQAPVPKPSK